MLTLMAETAKAVVISAKAGLTNTQIFFVVVDSCLLVFLLVDLAYKLFGITPPGLKRIQNRK